MKTCRKDTICYTIIQIKTQKDNTVLFNLTICHKQRIFPNEKRVQPYKIAPVHIN